MSNLSLHFFSKDNHAKNSLLLDLHRQTLFSEFQKKNAEIFSPKDSVYTIKTLENCLKLIEKNISNTNDSLVEKNVKSEALHTLLASFFSNFEITTIIDSTSSESSSQIIERLKSCKERFDKIEKTMANRPFDKELQVFLINYYFNGLIHKTHSFYVDSYKSQLTPWGRRLVDAQYANFVNNFRNLLKTEKSYSAEQVLQQIDKHMLVRKKGKNLHNTVKGFELAFWFLSCPVNGVLIAKSLLVLFSLAIHPVATPLLALTIASLAIISAAALSVFAYVSCLKFANCITQFESAEYLAESEKTQKDLVELYQLFGNDVDKIVENSTLLI